MNICPVSHPLITFQVSVACLRIVVQNNKLVIFLWHHIVTVAEELINLWRALNKSNDLSKWIGNSDNG